MLVRRLRTLIFDEPFAILSFDLFFLLFDLVFTFSHDPIHVFFPCYWLARQVTGEGSSQVLGLEKLCREGAGGHKVRIELQ